MWRPQEDTSCHDAGAPELSLRKAVRTIPPPAVGARLRGKSSLTRRAGPWPGMADPDGGRLPSIGAARGGSSSPRAPSRPRPQRTVYSADGDGRGATRMAARAGRARQGHPIGVLLKLPPRRAGENPADLLAGTARRYSATSRPMSRAARAAAGFDATDRLAPGHRGRRPGLLDTIGRPPSNAPSSSRRLPRLTARGIESSERKRCPLYGHPNRSWGGDPKSALSSQDLVTGCFGYPRVCSNVRYQLLGR